MSFFALFSFFLGLNAFDADVWLSSISSRSKCNFFIQKECLHIYGEISCKFWWSVVVFATQLYCSVMQRLWIIFNLFVNFNFDLILNYPVWNFDHLSRMNGYLPSQPSYEGLCCLLLGIKWFNSIFGRPYYRSSLWYSVSSVVFCLSVCLSVCRL